MIHPGASRDIRRWPTDHFATAADALADLGFTIVLTGSAAEVDITQEVAGQMASQAVDLTGKTNLGALAALLDRARLLISNDTGVSHLADALNIPSVIIFLTSSPARWAPLNSELHRAVGAGVARDLIPDGTESDTPPPETVSVQNVLDEAVALLRKEAARYV